MPIGGFMSTFPEGFTSGINIRGMPLVQMQPGDVFWLNNGSVLPKKARAGSDNNHGHYLAPFATLNYAIGQCVPGRGDIIFVGPGHKETISSATIAKLTCSGVAIIGLGAGGFRPRFTFSTATSANIPVAGTNISVSNCMFLANFADIVSAFTGVVCSFTGVIAGGILTASAVTGTIYPGATLAGTGVTQNTVILSQISGTTGGAGTYSVAGSTTVASVTMTTSPRNFAVDNCEFRDTSSALNFLQVFTAPATDNACDGLSITRSNVYGLGTTAATAMMSLGGNLDRLTIQGNYHANPMAANSSMIYQPTTTKVITRALIDRNTCRYVGADAATGQLLITTATTHTGVISRNFVSGTRAIASAVLVTGSSGFDFYENYYHLSADKSGVLLPAVQT